MSTVIDEWDTATTGPICDECGFEAKNEHGLHLHNSKKHGVSYPKADKAPRSTGGKKPSRQQSLQASLGIVALGVGVLDPYDGKILTDYIPAQAQALDAAANEYAWAAKVCEFLTMAGPVTLLASAFLPPIFLILAHHNILPGSAVRVAESMGGVPAPPPTPQGPVPPAQPQFHEDGSATVAGIHITKEQMDRAAESMGFGGMTGAAEVRIADNGPGE